MKTLNVDSLTNSILMAMAKELAKNDISIYEVDPNDIARNTLRPLIASFVADTHFKLAQTAMAEAEKQTKLAQDHMKKGSDLRTRKAA